MPGTNTKRETREVALEEFVRRIKSEKLTGLAGKVELSLTLSTLIKRCSLLTAQCGLNISGQKVL